VSQTVQHHHINNYSTHININLNNKTTINTVL